MSTTEEMSSNESLIGRADINDLEAILAVTNTDRDEVIHAVADNADVALEVIAVPALSVLAGREAGAAIASRPPELRPDAIFAANDLIAMGLLQALMMHNGAVIEVPDEIALIGYDDIDFASAAVVPLSSIRQPSALIGQTAVEILIEESADPSLAPRQIVFQPELVVRESTALA